MSCIKENIYTLIEKLTEKCNTSSFFSNKYRFSIDPLSIEKLKLYIFIPEISQSFFIRLKKKIPQNQKISKIFAYGMFHESSRAIKMVQTFAGARPLIKTGGA